MPDDKDFLTDKQIEDMAAMDLPPPSPETVDGYHIVRLVKYLCGELVKERKFRRYVRHWSDCPADWHDTAGDERCNCGLAELPK